MLLPLLIWALHQANGILGYTLDVFEAPVTVTPQQESSNTLNSSKFTFKRLNVYFWGVTTFTFGEITFTFGEITSIWGYSRRF